MHGDFDDMQDTEIRVTQLQTNLQLLKQRVDERKKLLLETLAFYKNNKQVSQLAKSFLNLLYRPKLNHKRSSFSITSANHH